MEKQRWEESENRGAEERRSDKRKSEKKEDAGARNGCKVAKHCVFPMICGSRGSKSRLAKAAGAEPCGQMRDEKLHAVVARSTFGSQNVDSTSRLGHIWKLRCRKSAHHCGAKHNSKSECAKHTRAGALLEVEMSKKCTPLSVVAQSTFPSQNVQNTRAGALLEVEMSKNAIKSAKKWRIWGTFGVQMSFRVAGARDCATGQKWAKREGFLALPKSMASVGHLKRIWKDAFSVAGAVQETCSSEMLGGQGADFLRVVAFWSIRSSVLGRWFCVTGAALCVTWHHFFVAGAILQRHGLENTQNALVRGRQLCVQLSIIEGSLAELLRFWCCQLRKLRKFWHCQVRKLTKSRRTACFLTLSSSKVEEVSQNCFVFNLADCS